MKFTIKEACIDSDQSLCSRCENGLVYKTDRMGVRRFCGILKETLRETVVQCSNFQDKTQLDLWSMQKIAWLVADKAPRSAGFRPPKDYESREPTWHLDSEGDVTPNVEEDD